jgi:mRNA interferase RelE/StbE
VRLVVEKAAARALRKMPAKIATAIMDRMDAIAVDPFGSHLQVKPLQGTKAGFRLRQGDWRVLYRVDRDTEAVYVEAVKTRGAAYR